MSSDIRGKTHSGKPLSENNLRSAVNAESNPLGQDMNAAGPKENYFIGKNPIMVIIRTRPYLFEERKVSTFETVNILDKESLIIRNKDEKIDIMTLTKEKLFRFDYIFDSLQNMIKISNFAIIEKYVPEIFKGRNLSFLLYGGELSGKTHSLVGNIYDPGILSVFLDAVFDHMDEFHYRDRSKIFMSFVEADDEKFRDLLTNLDTPLDLWIESKRAPFFIGLTRTQVENICEVQRALKVALKNSSGRDFQIENFAKLKANFAKTHFIIEVNVEYQPDEFSEKKIRSKITFVDFAGMEHNSYSDKFNKVQNSLISFSNCLRVTSEICNHLRKVKNVPYDSSRLTTYLKDALGGNSKTIFIGTLCPHILYMESLTNLLRQALQAKNILTTVKENITNHKILHINLKDTAVTMKRTMKMLSASLLSGDLEKRARQKVLAFCRMLLLDLKALLINFINQYSVIIAKEDKYNAESLNLIKIQIKGYHTILNSNDLKQFFMAKMPQYMKVNIEKQMENLSPAVNELLQELKQEYSHLKRIKVKIKILRRKIVPGNPYQITGNDLSYFYDFLQSMRAFLKYLPIFKECRSFLTLDYLSLVEDIYSELNLPFAEDLQEGDLLVDTTKEDKMVVNLVSSMKFTVESPRRNSPIARASTIINQNQEQSQGEGKSGEVRLSLMPVAVESNDEYAEHDAILKSKSPIRKSLSNFEFHANLAYSKVKGASMDLGETIAEESLDDEEKRRHRYMLSFMEYQRNEKNSSKLSGTMINKRTSPYQVFEGSMGRNGFYRALVKSRKNNSVKRKKYLRNTSPELAQEAEAGGTFQSFNFIANKDRESAKLSFIGGGNDAFEDSLLEEILNNKAMKFLEKEKEARAVIAAPLAKLFQPEKSKSTLSLPKIPTKRAFLKEPAVEESKYKRDIKDILKIKLTKQGIMESARKQQLRNYQSMKKTSQQYLKKFIMADGD